MAKQKKKKKTAAYAQTKRMISPKDSRIKKPQLNPNLAAKLAKQKADDAVRSVAQTPSGLFFTHNASLGPPYRVLVDTNFINFSIQNKLDIHRSLMDCLYAKCIPCITEAVMAELEKLGSKYRLALRLAKDPRFLRMPSYLKKGTYADDDIVEHARVHRCFIVATCDKDLKRRLRKIPGVPLISIKERKYQVERMPEAQH